MYRAAALLLMHMALLLLAASNFTLIGWLRGEGGGLQFNYFQFMSSRSWGSDFVSGFSLLQVLTYLLAYASGVVAYRTLRPFRQRLIVGAGLICCWVGLASFTIELSNWFTDSHRSLICNVPILAIGIAVLGIGQLVRGAISQSRPSPRTEIA